MSFKIKNKVIEDERVSGLLCDALEGGSDWYLIVRHEYPLDISYADFQDGGKFNLDGYWYPAEVIPLHPKCVIILKTKEFDDDRKRYRLDREALERGLKLMEKNHKMHWCNFMAENDDAETGDVFLQLCLFGKIVYG